MRKRLSRQLPPTRSASRFVSSVAAGAAISSATSASRRRDPLLRHCHELEYVAVRVFEIDATAAVPVIEFAVVDDCNTDRMCRVSTQMTGKPASPRALK